MSPPPTNTNPESDGHSVTAALLPTPGPFACAFFRCAIFASVPVLAAIVLGVVSSSQPLLRAASPLAALLALPLFILSFAFIRSNRRLAFAGFVVLLLLLLAGLGAPIYAE